MLAQQSVEIRLRQRAEPRRRAADVGLHDDRRAKDRHALRFPQPMVAHLSVLERTPLGPTAMIYGPAGYLGRSGGMIVIPVEVYQCRRAWARYLGRRSGPWPFDLLMSDPGEAPDSLVDPTDHWHCAEWGGPAGHRRRARRWLDLVPS